MKRIIEIPESTYEYYVKLSLKSDEQMSFLERIIVDSIPFESESEDKEK